MVTTVNNKYRILFVAIFITILLTPLESVSIGGDDSRFSIVKLSVLFLFALWGLSGFPYRVSKLLKIYLILFLYFVLTIFFSININHSADRLFLMLLPTIVLCSVFDGVVITRDRLIWILVAYFIGTLILSVFAYYNRAEILMNAVNESGERISALGHDENEMSYLLVLGVTCGLHLLRLKKNTLLRVLLIISILIFSFFTIATGSRTGMILLFVVFTIFALGSMRSAKGRLGLILFAIVLFVAASFFLPFISESTISRLFETRELVTSGNLSGRGTIWQNGMNAFFDGNVVTGAGYDNFMIRYSEYVGGNGKAAHNTYLSFLVCGGLLGFILFVVLLIAIWKECVKVYRLTGSLFVFAYYIPLLLTMFTLETTSRRWVFFIGIFIYRWRVMLEESKDSLKLNAYDQNKK